MKLDNSLPEENGLQADKARPQIWRIWAANLQRWGLGEFAASFLEASAPLNLVGAQAVYVSQPALDWLLPREHSTELAHLLEETQNTQAFISLLREEPE